MEKLTIKYEAAISALKSLYVLIYFIEHEKGIKVQEFSLRIAASEEEKIWRDSLIQRFEYSVDTLWKYLKLYLLKRYGADYAYPKDVFRASRNVGFVNEQEVFILLEMVDDRNLTSHTYFESLAQRIAVKIPDYYCAMKKILDQAH